MTVVSTWPTENNESSTSRFCPACGAAVRDDDLISPCPECGAAAEADNASSMMETLVLPDDSALSGSLSRSASGGGPVQRTAEDTLVGRRLHVYQCVSLIGSGGMGRVYLATHTDLQRRCALKILSPKRANPDEDYIQRFIHEGQAAASLVHPNIVTIHAVGQYEGLHFLEMEFIPGRSLQRLIEDEKQLSVDRALSLAALIADGLGSAHRSQIIHRDVKPDNVMLTRDGIPKISDFGLAKRVIGQNGQELPEGLCGTPLYMAPELFEGHGHSPASDVYALGVCLYQMLTGRVPFQARSLATLMWNGRHQAVPGVRELRPDVSLEVASCVAALTDPIPGNRPQNAVEAAQLLYAVLGHERDLESLLIEAFRHETEVTWVREGDRYQIIRRLPGNRQQTVYVEPSRHDVDDRLLLIYSVCCPVNAGFYETALRLNAEMQHGSVSIRDVNGQPQFVVADTYPRATVDPEEIRRSVLEIAMHADAVEHILTGHDAN